jgi:hypothetical protein
MPIAECLFLELPMPFTYDITTDRGKVRLLCTDSDSTSSVFDDSEIDVFLALGAAASGPANLFIAAALACETWARSRSKLAVRMRQADGSVTQRYLMEELLALAKSLREAALSGAIVTDTFATATPNELLDSFRPEWRGITDLPVVE